MARIKPKFSIPQPTLFDSLEMTSYTPPEDVELRFISFGSGSSGNCSYLGTRSEGILIDAGVRPDIVKEELLRRGISMSQIKGIILTHDHADHIRYTYRILKKNPHIALFSTPKTLSGIFLRHSLSPRLRDYHRPVYIETPFRIGKLTVTPFQVMHDGTDNVGFMIESGHKKFVVATDLGCISERAEHYLRQAQYMMIESNYDLRMLIDGPYPYHLKARIQAQNGHLDNAVTARFLAANCQQHLKYIFLCHLSEHNNTPEIALRESRDALIAAGHTVGDGSGKFDQLTADVQLIALPRTTPSQFFIFK